MKSLLPKVVSDSGSHCLWSQQVIPAFKNCEEQRQQEYSFFLKANFYFTNDHVDHPDQPRISVTFTVLEDNAHWPWGPWRLNKIHLLSYPVGDHGDASWPAWSLQISDTLPSLPCPLPSPHSILVQCHPLPPLLFFCVLLWSQWS